MPDANDDTVLIAGGRVGKVTWCHYYRSRATCDKIEDVQIEDADIGLNGLLAWHSTDALSYHGNGRRRTQPFTLAVRRVAVRFLFVFF